MPKKAYALDFDIYYAKDRNDYVTEIVQRLDDEGITLSEKDISQLGDYILFGKDEYHMSPVDTHEILNPPHRYSSYVRKEDQNASLDAMLEDPIVGPSLELENREVSPRNKSKALVFKPSIHRTTYDEEGNILEYGDDFDEDGNVIQPMRDLWEIIDKWQRRVDMYSGRIPADETVKNNPKTKYDLYRMNHMLIDMKRQQYIVKDCYKPILKSFTPPGGTKTAYDFDVPTGYYIPEAEWDSRVAKHNDRYIEQPPKSEVRRSEDGTKLFWEISKNVVDYENPFHINAILDNYVALLRHCYDKPDSISRCICFDIENFIEKAELSELEQFVLEQKVAHRNLYRIQNAILEETGECYSEGRLRLLMKDTIPKKLASAARSLRLESELKLGRIEGLTCTKCRRVLPKDQHFFARSLEKKTGFCSQCKDCQRKKRVVVKERKKNGNNRT